MSADRQAVLRDLFSAIEGSRYCVLRSYASLPDAYTGHDLDILATPEARKDIGKSLAQTAESRGWRLFRHERRQQLEEWVYWKELTTIVIQVSTTLDWHGCAYLDAAEVLDSRQLTPAGIPIPRPEHEALVSALSWVLWGGVIRERYFAQLVESWRRDPDEMRRLLHWAFGARSSDLVAAALDAESLEHLCALAATLRRALTLITLRRAPGSVVMGKLSRWWRGALAAARLQGGSIQVRTTRDAWDLTEPVLRDCFRRLEVAESESPAPFSKAVSLAMHQGLAVDLVAAEESSEPDPSGLAGSILSHFSSPPRRLLGLVRRLEIDSA